VQWWCAATSEPWSWTYRAYPGVWLFVALLVVVGVRARARAPAYAAGVLCAWLALDWPLGTLGGGYLLAAHTAQYVVLTFFAAPLLVLGLRRADGGGAAARLPRLHPLVALLVYNALLAATHVPAVSDALMRSQGGAALVDLAWLAGGIALWWPVLHPDPERRLRPPLAMGYLFAATILPTLPAALLIFADYPYYGVYELAPRAFGLSAHQDQQLAGLLMKVVGDPIVWASTAVIFFRWQAANARVDEEATLTLPGAGG
jgi:cytochrome c oxidase assembly factor CtaG